MNGDVDEGDAILAEVRTRIDALDDALVDLLAQRFAAVAQAARLKQPYGIPPLTPRRFAAVLTRVTGRAHERGLDSEAARRIWEAIHDEALRLEARVMGGTG
ncbi:chorismate mutase [Elioraea sp.]|uniref:chorismate mutase n=1 Tax=Elioraea sp. TaxID=2185103 RepID=UPI003F7040EA